MNTWPTRALLAGILYALLLVASHMPAKTVCVITATDSGRSVCSYQLKAWWLP